MDYIQKLDHPRLQNPVFIAAFEGWNDASEVATWTARQLVRQWSAVKFAELDPEEFYVFTDTRPRVRWDGNQRIIDWPANEFYYHQDSQLQRDFVVLLGVEPNLRWKTFTREMLSLIQEMQVSVAITLGGLLAAVPHTQPSRLTGTATDPDLLKRLNQIVTNTSRYEGPTGIVGTLTNAMNQEHIPTASLWGNVPHYLSARPNVKVSLAMLRQLERTLGLSLDLRRVERQAARFDVQVNEAVAGNTEIATYVRQLEEQQGRSGEEAAPTEELPSGEALVQELEEYLRRRQAQEGEDKS